MPRILPVFEEFIDPLDGKKFERDIYGLVPAYIEGARDKFACLADWSTINSLLAHKRFAKSHLSLAKEGVPVPWTQYSGFYTDIYGEYLSIRAGDLNKELSSGATMELVHIDDFHQPLRDVCSMLERRLRNRFFADAFACCRPVPGFFAHWDPDDNFVAQIIGKKHWKIMRPRHPHPLGSMREHETPPSEIHWQGIMEPGDLLYVPHGWWHEVSAVDGPSLHVSFSTFPVTGIDVSKEIVRGLEDQQFFRAGIPVFHTKEQRQEYFERLVREFLEVARGFDFESYLRAKAPGLSSLSLPWGAVDTAGAIPDNAQITWLPPELAKTFEEHGQMALEIYGKTFRFPVQTFSVIRDLIDSESMQLTRLRSRHGHVDVSALIVELVSAGLVAIRH